MYFNMWTLYDRRKPMIVLYIVTILVISTHHVTNGVLYPPFFNAALRKPVTSDPPDATCGEAAPNEYCDSSNDEQSTRTCFKETCTASCPHGDKWPSYQTVAQRFDASVYSLGGCVKQSTSFVAPTTVGVSDCLQFTGIGNDCSIPLQKEWLAPIVYINRIWQTSFALWLFNQLGNRSGTILDAFYDDTSTESVLRLVLIGDRLEIRFGQTTVTSVTWIIPQEQWTHIGVQLHNRTLSVFINGVQALPSYYDVLLRENNNAKNWQVGKSHDTDYDPFVGYIQDFRIYFNILVNRGIGALHNNGTMAETRIDSHCICPSRYPGLRASKETFCVQNPGQGLDTSEVFRLARTAHPLEYVNDDHHDRAWITVPPLEDASVEIDLGDTFQVHHIRIILFSPVPSLLTLERRLNDSATWQPWQYYSENCKTEVGQGTNEPLVNADDVICKELISFDAQFIYSGADIELDLLEGRTGNINGSMTSVLRDFLQARAVRVTLKGHPFVSDDMHKYHGISEIKVNATCDCNGHGSDCHLNQYPYVCACAAQSYTKGPQCNVCVDQSYEVATTDTTARIQCRPCDCNTNGTTSGSHTCQKDGGKCQCKRYVTGRACDTCADGYFNMTNQNAAGCERCTCNTNGTRNGSDVCDAMTGQCVCKQNIEGLKCDRCKSGFSMFSGDHPTGCLGCVCNESGTLPGNNSCDIYTAACSCKQYVTGRSCDKCQDGTYNLQSDNVVGCQPCHCNTSFGAINASCHVTSGQCNCAPHVTGEQCDMCSVGYYGSNMTTIQSEGCLNMCDCDPIGTESNMTGVCLPVGGQCTCKPGVTGRRCDECSPGGYGFGTSADAVCLPCDCDVRGTVNASIECSDTGACLCKPHVKGMKCNQCMSGYYGLDADVIEGCRPCDCFEHGTVANTNCSNTDGQCMCRIGVGNVNNGGRRCMGYVTSILPSYGPLSGGTNITMDTGYLGNISLISAYLGDQGCYVTTESSNQTLLTCTSPRLGSILQSRLLNVPQPVKVTWSDSREQAATQSVFTYLEDPIIENISPLRTFISGGVSLTVTGQHLNSVMFPYMTVTMVYSPTGAQSSLFKTVCDVKSSTRMICPTPELEIPDAFKGRRRRSADQHDIHVSRDHARERRDVNATEEPEAINNDKLTFYLGFILDGVQSYRNMSIHNPDIGIIVVYKNPIFEMFTEDDHVKPFHKYWPVNDSTIMIVGKYLNHGSTAGDYWIQIGNDNCMTLELHENALICVPPASEPDVMMGRSGSGPEHPQVVVHVGNINFMAGYLNYRTSIWDYKPFRYGIVGAACGLVLLLLVLIACCACRRSRDKTRTKHTRERPRSYISAYESKDGTMKSYMSTIGSDILSSMPGELRISITDLLINQGQLEMGKVIGQGHFGQVHIGFYTSDDLAKPEIVAIKTLKDDPMRTRQDTIQFLEEATMMKDFQHSNVLGVLGVVVCLDDVRVVLPYMENGDLKTFINREENMLTVGELIHFGLQIATGMCYLADTRFVHRDLACRNIMVNKNLIVKVADFGLSRDIYEQDYYRVATKKRPLPVKWMAVESLEDGVWTTKSDVWSYGVVLWELLTRGCSPYPTINSFDIKTYLLSGRRMERPDYAPDEIYSLMLNCWQEDPERRLTFKQIRDRMSYFLNEVNTHTFTRDKQGQQVPSIPSRKHQYLDLLP